jgi:hypothetical protein
MDGNARWYSPEPGRDSSSPTPARQLSDSESGSTTLLLPPELDGRIPKKRHRTAQPHPGALTKPLLDIPTPEIGEGEDGSYLNISHLSP